MKLFENGVGRPSNEILRKRKIFIASVVAAIALLLAIGGVLLFGNLNTDRLQGASNGSAYINLKVKNSAIRASGCTITIPYQIENRSRQTISVYSAKLTTSDNKTLASKSVSGSVPAGIGNTNTVYVTFNSKNLPTSGNIRTVIYFKAKGKEYWHTEYVTPSSSVYSTIKNCKYPTTTTKKTTKKITTTAKRTTAKATTKKTTTAIKSGSDYINHSVKNSAISVSGCDYLVVQANIQNRSNQTINVTRAKLTDSSNKTYTSVTKAQTIRAGVGVNGSVDFKFPLKGLPADAKTVRMVTYFKVNGVEKYIVEQITLPSAAREKLKSCKNASQDGNAYVNLSVKNSKITTNSNCKLVVPVTVENRSNQKIKITDAKITSQWTTGTVYATSKKTGSIAAGKGKETTVNFEFPVTGDAFPRGEQEFKVVVYFQVNGKGRYYIIDQIDTPNTAEEKIKHCKDKDGNSFINHSVDNSVISVDKNCNLVVKAKLKNKSEQKITATSAKLTSNGNSTTYVTAKASGDTVLKDKNSSIYTTFKFSQAGAKNAIDKEGSTIRMVTYFKVNSYGTSYWITEKITVPKTIEEKLNSCKTTTKKTSATKKANNTKKTNIASSSKLSLSCPSTAGINEWFKCSANLSGVKISVSSAGFTGNVLSYTTTSSDKVKDLRYNKAGTITVTASKSGYSTVKKTVKIVDRIVLSCPTSAKVNEWFKCTANLSGVKISVSSAGFTGNVLSYTTTSSDKVKDLRYNKAGTITVTASKSGYSTVKKTVVVK